MLERPNRRPGFVELVAAGRTLPDVRLERRGSKPHLAVEQQIDFAG
jgi:hypothetical protein